MERAEVRETLVAELANSRIPTTIMGLTFVGIGMIASIELGSVTFAGLTLLGGLCSAAKLAVVLHHRRRLGAAPAATLAAGQHYEAAHACTTWAMAASIGVMGAALFHSGEPPLHLVATALLFSYCSGVVSRVSVRPRIASVAIALAAIPCLVAAFLVSQTPHIVVAVNYLVFLHGAMESIRHAHCNASRHIDTRLQMAAIARLDPLTQLLNRFGLRERFDELARFEHQVVALHAFDLDGFKAVNDQHGHEEGDRLLVQIAERLRVLLGNGSIIARIGGDEFVVLQPDVHVERDAGLLARQVHETLTKNYQLANGCDVRIGVSLGYAIRPIVQTSLERLLRDADHMSYAVKTDGGGFRQHRGGDAEMAMSCGTRSPIGTS